GLRRQSTRRWFPPSATAMKGARWTRGNLGLGCDGTATSCNEPLLKRKSMRRCTLTCSVIPRYLRGAFPCSNAMRRGACWSTTGPGGMSVPTDLLPFPGLIRDRGVDSLGRGAAGKVPNARSDVHAEYRGV